LGRGLTILASVTLFVYLLHGIVAFIILKAMLPPPITAGLVLILSFVMAIMVRNFLNSFEQWNTKSSSHRLRIPFSGQRHHAARPEEDDTFQ
jgi:membrane protein implicated in regulation of membrane protease activity